MRNYSRNNIKDLWNLENFSRFHNNKFLVLVLVFIFSTSLSFGAEGISVPMKKAPVIAGETGGASKIEQSRKIVETSEPSTRGIKEEQKQESPFVKSLLNMFKALFAVLVLIGGIAGIILFYRWYKTKAALTMKQQEAAMNLDSREPETVSEAVASFVKHRIRK